MEDLYFCDNRFFTASRDWNHDNNCERICALNQFFSFGYNNRKWDHTVLVFFFVLVFFLIFKLMNIRFHLFSTNNNKGEAGVDDESNTENNNHWLARTNTFMMWWWDEKLLQKALYQCFSRLILIETWKFDVWLVNWKRNPPSAVHFKRATIL